MAKFKNSKNVYLTKNLFIEYCFTPETAEKALYTLTEEDKFIEGKLYPSVYKLFLSCDDPTGYKFAEQYLGSWYHYELLLASSWFKPTIDRALMELEVRTRSRALANIISESKDKQSKSQFQANKYLMDRGWVDKNTVGRPTKEKILEEANKLFKEQDDVDATFDRVVN